MTNELKTVKETDDEVARLIDVWSRACYINSEVHGFWPGGPSKRNKGEQLALIHSEVSEALEAVRKPKMDDHCPEFTSEEIELADVLVRVFDYAGGHGLRLGAAFVAKFRFNVTRPHKHGKEF